MKVHHIIATKPFYCTYTSQIYTYCMRLVEQREVVVVGDYSDNSNAYPRDDYHGR